MKLPSDAGLSIQLCDLPSHLWSWLARHGDISDFCAVLRCNSLLYNSLSFDALWHYHAFTSGYARSIVRADASWVYPFMPKASTEYCIDWKKFLRMSCETRHHLSMWVRIRDVDIRVPLPHTPVQNKSASVLPMLSQLVRVASKSAGNAGSHLRLRRLQWAGRPGPVVHRGFIAGDHLLLEWACNHENRWPLPPHALTTPANSAPAAVDPSRDCQVLVRVIGVSGCRVPSLLKGECWLALDLTSATLHCLYTSLAELLRDRSPCKDWLPHLLEFQLMDSHLPHTSATHADTKLLRELSWTHCETLCLEWTAKTGDGHPVLIWREEELASMGQSVEQYRRSAHEREGHNTLTNIARENAVKSENDPGAGSAGEVANSCWERLAAHYRPKLLPNTKQTGQFEFHPSLPEVLLIGDKKGGVNVVHTGEERLHCPLVLDSCPVLGLAWMNCHAQRAVCGAAHSGQISFVKYDPEANMQDSALQQVLRAADFPKLSSLSVNCTDDFLLASGFTHDLSLYDTTTGQLLHQVHEAHGHAINISRFAHRAPHIFATASFDNTCKLWDLRQPLIQSGPVKVLNTGGINVSCAFAPDDNHLLCSGVGSQIFQIDLPSFRKSPTQFPLRPPTHQNRFRRAVYTATGHQIVTTATEESHIRIMSSTGRNMGIVDFCGLLDQTANLQQPFLESTLESQLGMLRQGCKRGSLEYKLQRAVRRGDTQTVRDVGFPLQGDVLLDGDFMGREGQTGKEYIQSVRTHPVVGNRIGVLLSSPRPAPQSYIALVHLDPDSSKDN